MGRLDLETLDLEPVKLSVSFATFFSSCLQKYFEQSELISDISFLFIDKVKGRPHQSIEIVWLIIRNHLTKDEKPYEQQLITTLQSSMKTSLSEHWSKAIGNSQDLLSYLTVRLIDVMSPCWKLFGMWLSHHDYYDCHIMTMITYIPFHGIGQPLVKGHSAITVVINHLWRFW